VERISQRCSRTWAEAAKAGTKLQCRKVGQEKIEGNEKGYTDKDKKMKVMIRRKIREVVKRMRKKMKD
jgi:hypothetical protein